MKNVLFVIGFVLFMGGLYLVFTPPVQAQMRPCVWPNTCG